jgi:hypothetical protein
MGFAWMVLTVVRCARMDSKLGEELFGYYFNDVEEFRVLLWEYKVIVRGVDVLDVVFRRSRRENRGVGKGRFWLYGWQKYMGEDGLRDFFSFLTKREGYGLTGRKGVVDGTVVS